MSDFAKMDIFFVVTTAAVAVLAILLAVAMVYIIKISRDIKYISQKARGGADLISQDLSELRQNVKDGGAKLKFFASFFNNLGKKSKK
jgi:diacylglycerol kinase